MSLTSQVSCRHGSKTTFSQVWLGLQRGDDALDRVVKQDRADADAHVELEAVGGAEERLVLADRFALVVEHRPAAAHPARSYVQARLYDQGPGSAWIFFWISRPKPSE